MSDVKFPPQGETPEQVAYKLMELIASVEGREAYAHGKKPMTREYIIKAYSQCLHAVRNPSHVQDSLKMAGLE